MFFGKWENGEKSISEKKIVHCSASWEKRQRKKNLFYFFQKSGYPNRKRKIHLDPFNSANPLKRIVFLRKTPLIDEGLIRPPMASNSKLKNGWLPLQRFSRRCDTWLPFGLPGMAWHRMACPIISRQCLTPPRIPKVLNYVWFKSSGLDMMRKTSRRADNFIGNSCRDRHLIERSKCHWIFGDPGMGLILGCGQGAFPYLGRDICYSI